MVAPVTLDHSVWVRVLVPEPNGAMVKRLRRRPLTAKTGVRFPYELLTINNLIAQPIEDAESQIMVLQHFLFTRVARKIACLHADLASTAITRETRKACFS